MNSRNLIEDKYKNVCKFFNIGSRLWAMCHEQYSAAMFCKENRKDIIAEYFILEDLVNDMKRNNVVYYYGIDIFLDEYRNAVYRCLKDNVL